MNKFSSNLIVGTTLFLAIGLALWQLYGEQLRSFFPHEAPVVTQGQPERTLLGHLTLTLKPMLPAEAHAAIYNYSFGNNTLNIVNNAHNYFAPAFSTDDRVAVVAGDEETEYQLYIANRKNQQVITSLVPPSPALSAGAAAWSPDNTAVIYEAQTALPSVDNFDIENSRIVYANLGTSEQRIIDTGASPVFEKDGSILYLKDDGVYHTQIVDGVASGTTRILTFTDNHADIRSRIALSPDGALLAVTIPDYRYAAVFSIDANNVLVKTNLLSNTIVALWPVFSPDSSALAFINISIPQTGEVTKKSLMVFDSTTGILHEELDLKAFNEQFASLTGWTK